MADETEQDPVEQGIDEIDVEIKVVDDVNEISKNKHDTGEHNYNSGIVSLKCVINGRCPIVRQPLVDNTLVFNSETIRGFSEEDLHNLLFVPGDDGIFLSTKYVYRSNFLFVGEEEVVPSGPGGTTDSGSVNNPPEYKEEQSWDVVNSVFDPSTDSILKPTQYLSNGQTLGARWTIVRETQHTDNEKISNTKMTASNAVTSFNPNEAPDSAVYAPCQGAASPTTVDCKIQSRGIHWRVKKKTPLFKGEDFFVEFRARALSQDFKNVDSVEFEDSSYNFLDSVRSLQGSMEEFPANAGVVTYDMKRDEKNGKPTGEWEKIEESVPYFDLNKQSYYIIEMGTESSDIVRYFIIITMKANPTFVKVVNGKSYYIGKYEDTIGESLIKESRFRMTVRNHLGKLVISFLGLEANPWIISDRKISKDDAGILIVPASKISIWGGNLAASFIFGPLQYSSEYTLELPQSEKSKKNPLNPVEAFKEKEPYELPLIGAAYNVALLSSRDRGIDAGSKFVSKADENSSASGGVVNTESSVDETGGISSESYLEGREPMFTSDMQYALEAKVTISTDGEASVPGQFEQPMATYFLNTGKYIKSTIAEKSDEEQTMEDISNAVADAVLPGINSPDIISGARDAINDFQINSNIDFAPSKDMASRLELEMLLKKDVDIQNARQEVLDAGDKVYDIELNSTQTGEQDNMGLSQASSAEQDAKDNLAAVSAGTDSRNQKRYMKFYLRCRFVAGHHQFDGWKLLNCKTPVLTNIRLVCIPNKDEPAWKEEPVDVSGHVMKFSDSWSSQDFHTMEHTGSISFLINPGLSIPNNQSEYLQSVQSKAFYIEVWAGYQGCNYSQLDGNYKLFTGLCFGGVITIEAGKRIMDCQIVDYSKICQESYIFNSPFFDGMRDLNAIRELSDMIGLRSDEGSPDAPDPGYLVRMAAETETNDNLICATPDGRGYTTSPYALPASYDRIQQPFYRFADGSGFWENMQTLTQKAGKVIFFDAYGMLHYEELPIMKLMYGNISPEDVPVLWQFVKLSSDEGQQIFNSLVDEKAVSDVFNSINIMTSTPDYEMIINSDVNWDSISDPNSPGFLGYKKIFFQQDGIFGSLEATKNLINQYKLFYRAPIVYKFETYGQPIRCFDIASVDGQKLIIVNVSSEINKAENKWWQTIEGEWYHGETTV